MGETSEASKEEHRVRDHSHPSTAVSIWSVKIAKEEAEEQLLLISQLLVLVSGGFHLSQSQDSVEIEQLDIGLCLHLPSFYEATVPKMSVHLWVMLEGNHFEQSHR